MTVQPAGSAPEVLAGAAAALRRAIRAARRWRGHPSIARGLLEMDSREADESLYRTVFSASPAAMALLDRDHQIVAVNRALATLLGRQAADLCGRELTELSVAPHPARLRLMAEKAALQGTTVVVEHRLDGGRGERWARTSLQRLETGDAGVEMVAVVEDMTSVHEALEEQRREAELDPLTGLLNRRGGDRRLRLALDHMAQYGPVAVIVADADGLKEINDRYGHAAGDEVLAGIAGRLRAAIRNGDDVARLGGDEFIVVAWVADESEAETITARCVRTVANPIRASRGGGPHHVTLSAGVAVAHPGRAVEADALIEAADQALYRAKAEGGNRWVMAEL